jgi:hypothetical protein
MEASCSSEESADFQWTGRRYIPQERTVHNHRYENLKFFVYCLLCYLFSYLLSGIKELYVHYDNVRM